MYPKIERGTPPKKGPPNYLLNFKSSAFFDFSCCLRQRQGENAVFIRGRDLVAVDAVKIKASCKGAVGTLPLDIIFLFVLFLVFGLVFSVNGEITVSDFGVDILFGEAGELSVKNVCVLGLANIGLEGRKLMSEKALFEILHCFERVVEVGNAIVASKGCEFKHNRILLIDFVLIVCVKGIYFIQDPGAIRISSFDDYIVNPNCFKSVIKICPKCKY